MFNLNAAISAENTKNKIIFWDVDGTLAPYRYNGHVGDPNGTNNGQSAEEIAGGIFLQRPPSKFMQAVLKECQAKEHIIMGHFSCEKEVEDKHKWLDMHYPFIKKRLFLSEDRPKADGILEYCRDNGISLDEVLFVDDILTILRDAERKGIESWHISSFMDWFM